MSNGVRTRTLSESGAWVEADIPAERQPKSRRFILTASMAPNSQPGAPEKGGIIGEGICFSDGTVAVRHRERRSTIVYDTVEDVIAAGPDALTWID